MKKIIIIISVAILAIITSIADIEPGITVCDVGQGDATIIKDDRGKVILSDCGPDELVLSCLAQELGFWQKEIDAIIISHPHSDHFWGCFSVIERYVVENIIISDAPVSDSSYQELLSQAQERGIMISEAGSGDSLHLSDECAMEFLDTDYQGDNLNDFSLGFRLDCGNFSFLSLGDLEKDEESELAGELSADIFKVSHHGGASSNSQELLKKISPSIAVISVGEGNSYGHPSEEVLTDLVEEGAKIWRTDEQGSFKFYPNFR